MRKFASMLVCLLLIMTMAVSASANGDLSTTESSAPADTSHTHSWTVTRDTATCDLPGKVTKTCSCGETSEEDSPAKGHSWNNGEVIREADCQQTGIKIYTCSVCKGTREETIPMTQNHDFGSWQSGKKGHTRACRVCLVEESAAHSGTWNKSATTHALTCTDCGYSETGSHSWDEEIVKKPTCKADGLKKKSCTICGYSENIVLTKLTTHTYDSACDEECNVCGFERHVEHSFTTTWSKDYKGHWHECTKCGDRKDEEEHLPGPEATEEKEQVCKTCGYVIAHKKEHVHSYGSEWTSDGVGHWHACAKCDEERDYASHQYDDDCDGQCNTCGYKRKNTHTYGQTWQNTKFDHWNVCTVCGEESKREKHVPGEKATDKAPQLCTVCGFELAPIQEHTHDFGTVWFRDDSTHWQKCVCGELSVPLTHIWDAGRENRQDTITYTCVSCGAEKTAKAPSSGFPWLIVLLSILALGCLGGIGVLLYLLKREQLKEEDEFEEFGEEPEAEASAEEAEEVPVPEEAAEDQEEKMIDDYFASLNMDNPK